MALNINQQALAKLYLISFNRAPEKSGLDYWLSEMAAGKSLTDILKTVFSLDIVKALYPDSMSNSAFLTAIYNNGFGKAPDADGLAYWNSQLAAGRERSALVMDMIDAGLNSPDGTPGKAYVANRYENAQNAVDQQVIQGTEISVAKLTEIMATVNADSATVTAAATRNAQYSGAKIDGTVADGYIKNATVFADANGDGIWNEGEAKTTSDANGNFSLSNAKGTITVTGGTDIATNLAHTGVLKAPQGSAVVNPLTALQQAMVEQGKSAADAQAAVIKAFGLSSSVSLQDYDPLATAFSATATAAEKTIAVQLQAAAAKVQNLLVTAATALTGAAGTGATATDATNAVLASLASNIGKDTDGVVSLTDQTLLKAVLTDSTTQTTNTALKAAATSVTGMATSFATIMADSAAKVDTVMSSTSSSALTQVAQIAQVQTATQGTVATQIGTAAATGSLSNIVSNVTGSALTTLVNNATIGDLDPKSTTDSTVISTTNSSATSSGGGGDAPDTTAPTVSSVSSSTANGAYKTGQVIEVTVQFNEAVTVVTTGGTPSIALETGTTDRTAPYASGSGTNTLTFNYTVQAGDTAADLDFTATTALALNGGTIKDAAGNNATLTLASPAAANSLGANKAIEIDTTAPTTSLATVTLDLATASDTGANTGDDITSATTPTITVSTLNGMAMAVNDVIEIIDTSNSDAIVGSYTVQAGDLTGGNWNGTTKDIVLSTLAAGTHALKVRLGDLAGNTPATASTAALSMVVDTTADAAPGAVNLADADDTGSSNSDNLSKNTTGLTFTGTGVNDSVVTLFADADNDGVKDAGEASLGAATVAGGTWSIDAALAEGSHHIRSYQTDPAGNLSALSTDLAVTVDATPDAAPASVNLAAADDTGVSSTDNITQNTTALTFDGTGVSGSTVSLFSDTDNDGVKDAGETVLGTATVASGVWTIDAALATGTHHVRTYQTDAAGNDSALSGDLVVTVDATADAAPGSVNLADADDTGSSNSDNVTQSTTALTFDGTGVNGSVVTLFADADNDGVKDAGEAALGAATVASGVWTIDAALAAGTHHIRTYQTDAAGNVSALSADLAVTVDTTPDAAPGAVNLADADDTGVLNSDNLTKNTSALTFDGTGVTDSVVSLFSDADNDGVKDAGEAILGTATVAGGTWNMDINLAAGAHHVRTYQTDAAGNVSVLSTDLLVTVDTTAPVADASMAISAVDIDTSGGFTASDSITLKFAEAVAVANITVPNLVLSAHTLGVAPTVTALNSSNGYAQEFTIMLGAGATVAATDTITVAQANVVDTAGNQAAGSVVFTLPAPVGVLRATTAVDTLAGTGVDDVFVAVGVTAAGQYSGTDSNFSNLTTINGNATSEINGTDSFDGGAGFDTLHVYGTTDLTGVTLTSIERVVLHSDVTFSAAQMAALNTAGALIVGDGTSIMRMTGSGTVDMSAVNLQAIGQFDLGASLTAQISQTNLGAIGTIAAKSGSYFQAAPGTPGGALDFAGKNVYGEGSVKDINGTTVSSLDGLPGVGAHLNTVVSSVAALITSMNTQLGSVPGYTAQDAVNLTVASMSLYVGSQSEGDVVMAGSNHAFLRGGGFNDTLIGGAGTNFFSGAAGNDTITGGAVRDFAAGDAGDDTINGLGGNDFLNGENGADTINGGAGQDFIMPGDGADIVIVDNAPDFISLYSSTGVAQFDNAADTIRILTKTGLSQTTFTNIVGFETTAAEDALAFDESVFINGNAGAKSVVGTGAAGAAFNLDTADFRGIVKITDNAAVDFLDVGARIGSAVSGAAAGDAFVFAIDNGTNTLVLGWDDRVASGGDNDGQMDAVEFIVIATLVGMADVSALDANNLTLV